ncbi:MAG TPA: 4'-phosphopantetheinyl transferase superfamily protein [Candidatus Binataceae bacterium]|nr:4'-phosphopantetheinyl transferase superfamily protein [Candidatus Binataceae bacterium]
MPQNASRLRCGIDTVQLARMERLLAETPPADRIDVFCDEELREAGTGASATASLAARFAAKEACLKLLPRETALGAIEPRDFAICRNGYGEPAVTPSLRAQQILDQYRLGPIAVSLTHDSDSACAVAIATPRETRVTALDRAAYNLFPVRRGTALRNLRRAFADRVDEEEIQRLARASYGHLARSIAEVLVATVVPGAHRRARVRIENPDSPLRAKDIGRGLLFLTGHFGNWEYVLPAAIEQFPEWRGRFHFLRKRLPGFLDGFVTRRFTRAGLGVIPTRGGLDTVLDRLAARDAVVFVFDQHAGGRDGITVDFMGHPASTFRSLATIALSTGAPVIPGSSYREPDGTHVLHFEDPLETIDTGNADADLRANTQMYNAALERMIYRHPEQWFWLHRRWKDARGRVV